jgi:hypothetical protein
MICICMVSFRPKYFLWASMILYCKKGIFRGQWEFNWKYCNTVGSTDVFVWNSSFNDSLIFIIVIKSFFTYKDYNRIEWFTCRPSHCLSISLWCRYYFGLYTPIPVQLSLRLSEYVWNDFVTIKMISNSLNFQIEQEIHKTKETYRNKVNLRKGKG